MLDRISGLTAALAVIYPLPGSGAPVTEPTTVLDRPVASVLDEIEKEDDEVGYEDEPEAVAAPLVLGVAA